MGSFIFNHLIFLSRSISLKLFHLAGSSSTTLHLGTAIPLLHFMMMPSMLRSTRRLFWLDGYLSNPWFLGKSSIPLWQSLLEFKIRVDPAFDWVTFFFFFFFLILEMFSLYFHGKRYFQYFTRKYWMSLLAVGHKCHKTDLKTGISPT